MTINILNYFNARRGSKSVTAKSKMFPCLQCVFYLTLYDILRSQKPFLLCQHAPFYYWCTIEPTKQLRPTVVAAICSLHSCSDSVFLCRVVSEHQLLVAQPIDSRLSAENAPHRPPTSYSIRPMSDCICVTKTHNT